MRTKQQVECDIKNLQQTIDKLKYELQKIKEKDCYYHTGQWFDLPGCYCADEGVLSCVGENMVTLICIDKDDANRWREPVHVESVEKITQEEFEQITGGTDAKLISNPLFCKES